MRTIEIDMHVFCFVDANHHFWRTVREEVAISNNRYAAIGLRFVPHVIDLRANGYSDLPRVIRLLSGDCLTRDIFPLCRSEQLSSEAKSVFFHPVIRKWQRPQVIKVYCFEDYCLFRPSSSSSRGATVTSRMAHLVNMKNSIFLASARSPFTLSHEISHVLLNETHSSRYYVPEKNIFSTPASGEKNEILGEEWIEYDVLMNGRPLHPACRNNQQRRMRCGAIELVTTLD